MHYVCSITIETLRCTLEFTIEITLQPVTEEKTNYNAIISSV